MNLLLHLADTSLISSHRNSEWCGHGPILEQDIALTNIALDLIGQARNFYQYAATMLPEGTTEDSLAYHRDPHEFLHPCLAEKENGDWAHTILRQFFLSNFQYFLFEELAKNKDEQIAAIAAKSIKEITYHLRWSAEWVIRLGDGTNESHERMVNAVNSLWPYTAELFIPAPYEIESGIDKILPGIEDKWRERTAMVFREAKLKLPEPAKGELAGKIGKHGAELTTLLEEMQILPRTYPDAIW